MQNSSLEHITRMYRIITGDAAAYVSGLYCIADLFLPTINANVH